MEARALGRASCFWGLGLVGLAALAGACESKGDVRRAVVLSSADLQALLQDPTAPETIVPGYGLPGGMRLDRIIAPAGDDAVLVKRDTYTDGYKSAYLTTEVWAGFDEVWVQPMYVAVTKYNVDAPPERCVVPGKKWRPIFGVGPDSAFYSPYWQTIYFQVPDCADIASYNSVRDVLDRGFDFRPAEGRLMALVPSTVGVPARVTTSQNGEEQVGGPSPGMGVFDGQDQPFLDFGTDTFTWDADRVVEEVPLFVWVVRDESGALQSLDMPNIGGSGPLYSGRKPKVVGGKPKYGSYWRIYTVELQPGWRVFAPKLYADTRDRLATTKYLYEDPPYSAALDNLDPKDATVYDDWLGRVLIDPTCVKNEYAINPSNDLDINLKHPDGTFDPVCQYVDSQKKIEDLVPAAAIRRTDILVTCPFITYDFQAVVLP